MSVRLAIERKPFLETATARYQKDVALAKDYLLSRGIDGRMAQRFRLGVCSSPLPEHEAWRGRLTIPYLTVMGPLALKARCCQFHDCKEAGHSKYLCETDAPPLLYNATDLLRDEDVLIVCEGEIDAIISSGILGFATVGFPGAAAWRAYFNRAVSPDWAQIIVIADGDDPGRDAARSVAKHLRGTVRKMPDGEDLNSYYLSRGIDATRAFVLEGHP